MIQIIGTILQIITLLFNLWKSGALGSALALLEKHHAEVTAGAKPAEPAPPENSADWTHPKP